MTNCNWSNRECKMSISKLKKQYFIGRKMRKKRKNERNS